MVSLPIKDKVDRANDLIAFLSAFEVPMNEAADIFRIAGDRIGAMSVPDYAKAGEPLAAVNNLFNKEQNS